MTIGDLYINASPFPRLNPTATLNISANTLTANNETVGDSLGIGNSGGVGAINQSGGTNRTSGNLALGYYPTDTGTYTLSGGILNIGYEETVGYGGTATFNQSGGTNSAILYTVGTTASANGGYSLSGGIVNANMVIVGGDYTGSPLSAQPGGTGVLTVSGTGVLNISDYLDVFHTSGSSLNLSGGTINTPAILVDGNPSLFHWTSGVLHITTSATFDPSFNRLTSLRAFGPALSLGPSQTLSLTGDEGIGGVDNFQLTVGSGGTSSVSGTLTINSNGTLQLNGGTLSAADIANYGRFTINSGSLTTGDVTLGSTSTLGIGLGGTARGSQYGALTASGQLALDGSLVVSLNSFTPLAGQMFDVLDWGPGC